MFHDHLEDLIPVKTLDIKFQGLDICLLQYLDLDDDSVTFGYITKSSDSIKELCNIDTEGFVHIHSVTDRDDVIGKIRYNPSNSAAMSWKFESFVMPVDLPIYTSVSCFDMEMDLVVDLARAGILSVK